MTIEIREWRGGAPEAKDDGTYSGRAIPFDAETQIGPRSWGWVEKFNRSAFNKYLREGDTVWLDQHDSRLPVARTSAGTLTMTKRNGGLEWDSEPTSRASYVADVMENIRCGNYGGCSVGFECVRDAWTDDKGEPSDEFNGTHREVLEAKLPEFSTVTFPAYGDTSVQQNSAGRDNALLEARRAAYEAAQEALAEERAAEVEETPASEADEKVEERSEPGPTDATGDTTHENDENETALADQARADRFRETGFKLSRMSDLG